MKFVYAHFIYIMLLFLADVIAVQTILLYKVLLFYYIIHEFLQHAFRHNISAPSLRNSLKGNFFLSGKHEVDITLVSIFNVSGRVDAVHVRK